MKSQIIQKCLNEKVRDKGLTNANITLADLLTYGRTLEATKLQTMAMLNPVSNRPASTVNAINVNNNPGTGNRRFSVQHNPDSFRFPQKGAHKSTRCRNESNNAAPTNTCSGCGGPPHHRRRCRAWGKTCHNCKRRNHFSSVCRSTDTSSKSTHYMETELSKTSESVNMQPVYDEYEHLSLYRTETANINVKPYCCTLTLNNIPTMMVIDTGASVSIISTQQVELLRGNGQQLQIETDNLPVLRTYSGEAMQPEGRIMLNVVHEDKAIKLPCLIVKGDGPNLLGRDWLEHLNLNFINLHQLDSEDFASMFPELFEPGLGKRKCESKAAC
ncbi:hypothetical protein SNE40_020569 [Patella caerulea]|uniref:Peptidase A2 domain-containing protein n=1 Tax=Patella caerulea TaxID=87958 RepID=A0AAN8PFS1_PATCE